MLTIAPAPARDHLLAHHPRAVPDAVDVDLPDRAPLLVGHLQRGPVVTDAGVVDQHVDRADLGHHRAHAVDVGDIGDDALRARRDDDLRARLAQRGRDRRADPAPAAGDDGDLAVEPERVQDAQGWTMTFTLPGSSRPTSQCVLRRIELVVARDYRLQVNAAVRRQRDRGRVRVRVAERPGHPDLLRLDLRQRELAGLARPQPDEHRRCPPAAAAPIPAATAAGCPEHSISTSAVDGSSRPETSVRVAPVRAASASRVSLTSEISTCVAPNASATCITSSPIGPAPVTSTRSPGGHARLAARPDPDRQRLHQRADVVGQRVGQREREVLVDDCVVRERAVDRRRGEEHDVRAEVVPPRAALLAAPARHARLQCHPVADGVLGHLLARPPPRGRRTRGRGSAARCTTNGPIRPCS